MSIEYIDGFELYGAANSYLSSANSLGRWMPFSFASQPVIDTGRNSGRSVRLGYWSSGEGPGYRDALKRGVSVANVVSLNVGFAVKVSSISYYPFSIFSLRDSTGGLVTIVVSGNGKLAYGTVDWGEYSNYSSPPSETEYGTQALSTNTWIFLEFLFSISGSNLTIASRINGGIAETATVNVGSGRTITEYALLGDFNSTVHFDDLYVRRSSAMLDAGHTYVVAALAPDGLGGRTDFSANAAANVNNIPENGNSFAQSLTQGQKQTWTIGNVPAHIKGSIQAVQHHIRAKSDGLTGTFVQPLVRIGSTDYPVGATSSVSTTNPILVARVQDSNPALSQPWTVAAVNSLEIGVEHASS